MKNAHGALAHLYTTARNAAQGESNANTYKALLDYSDYQVVYNGIIKSFNQKAVRGDTDPQVLCV